MSRDLSDVKLPPLTKALVDALDKQFPEKCPSIADTERMIWMYAGKRELVRYIQNQFRLQNEE